MSLTGKQLLTHLRTLGVTHVVWLPDAFTGTWEQDLASTADITLVRVCREGEAWAVAAGLWLGGRQPLIVLQNTGLFESGDALRNVLFDLGLPLYALVGYRNFLTVPSADTAKQYTEPILRAWNLDYVLLDGSDPGSRFVEHYGRCRQAGVPGVALILEGRG